MSASSADGESDSSVIRMTLAPRGLRQRDDLLGRQLVAAQVIDDHDRVAAGPQVLRDVGPERLVGVVDVGDQLVKLHRQQAGDQPREVAAGDDDVLRARGQQGDGSFDLGRRHRVRQPRDQSGSLFDRAQEDAVVGRHRPAGPGPADRALVHRAGDLAPQALLKLRVAAEPEPVKQAQHGRLARPRRRRQRGRALQPGRRIAGEQGARHLPLGRGELVHPLKDLVTQRQGFCRGIRHVVIVGSGPVPRAENIAGELWATTIRPSPPTAMMPPVDPRWASSVSMVSRTAAARPAPE